MALVEDSLTWPKVTSLVAVGLLALALWRRYCSPIADFPGPFTASFTRLWHITKVLAGDQNVQIARLHEKHGHFVRISHDEISVTHPEAVKKIFLTSLRKGDWYSSLALPDYRFQSPMSIVDPKEKKEKSKYTATPFAFSNVIKSEEYVSKCIESLLGWCEVHASSKTPMELSKFITFTAVDVIGEVVFSQAFGFLEKGQDIDNALGGAVKLVALATVSGLFPRIVVALMANPVTTWLSMTPLTGTLISAKRALAARENNPNSRLDMVSHWLRQHDRTPDKVTSRDVVVQALSIMGAGSDTVSCAIQSFVYHMICHPNAWKLAQEEIDEAKHQGLCQSRVISYSESQQLPFLQACVKESLRIFPPAPMSLPRLVPRGGITVGDRLIPEGTTVSINPYAFHRSKEIWGEDACEFRPNRWLEKGASDKDKYLIPFGAGYNACPGQNLARIEVYKAVSTLVRDFNIRQVEPLQEWRWDAYLTVVPHSWPVFIEKREPTGIDDLHTASEKVLPLEE